MSELSSLRADVIAVISRYAHLGDLGDSDGLAALFHTDGVLDAAHGVHAEGRSEISDYLALLAERGERGGPSFVRHHVSSVDILDLEVGRALVRSYFLVLTDSGIDHHGRYRDILTMTPDGTWLFAHRSVRLDGAPKSAIFETRYPAGSENR